MDLLFERRRDMKLTKRDAVTFFRRMWKAMKKELGNNPSPDARIRFKKRWCQDRNEKLLHDCYLCEYAKGRHNDNPFEDYCVDCPIDWGNGRNCRALTKNNKGEAGSFYLMSPLDDILALPYKNEKGGKRNERRTHN